MVAFGHTAVGAIVGLVSYQLLSQNDVAVGLVLTGFLGIGSHYLMDLLPHGHFFRDMKNYNKKIPWIILIDALLPFFFLLSLAHFSGKSALEILYIFFGIGGAQLPDVIDGLKRLDLLPRLKILKIESDFHMSTHWHGKEEEALLFGIADIWQILTFILATLLLIR